MRFLFIGGDARMDYAARMLSHTHEVLKYGEAASAEAIFNAIVFPLPLTKDGETVFGAVPRLTFEELSAVLGNFADEHTLVAAGGECRALSEMCEKLGCRFENYFARESLTLQNAALTAEAALCLLSQSGDGALLGSAALIAGSGRIAFFLADRLRACGCAVTFAARNPDKRELARLNGFSAIPLDGLSGALPAFDFIANTIPAPIFDEAMFSKMKENAVYEELATLPEQPRRAFAERFGVKYIYAGGLPGKYSPKAAGEFIAQTLGEILKEHAAFYQNDTIPKG